MKSIKYLLICFLSCIYATNSVAQCDHPDYEGLMELYNATNGNDWGRKDGWGDNTVECDPCKWYGIGCSSNRVTSINLEANNLTGFLPDLKIDSLRVFNLKQNRIGGNIPNFQLIPILKILNLASNLFDGNIPNFNSLNALEEITLANNFLNGNIPEFTNSTHLGYINFEVNY